MYEVVVSKYLRSRVENSQLHKVLHRVCPKTMGKSLFVDSLKGLNKSYSSQTDMCQHRNISFCCCYSRQRRLGLEDVHVCLLPTLMMYSPSSRSLNIQYLQMYVCQVGRGCCLETDRAFGHVTH